MSCPFQTSFQPHKTHCQLYMLFSHHHQPIPGTYTHMAYKPDTHTHRAYKPHTQGIQTTHTGHTNHTYTHTGHINHTYIHTGHTNHTHTWLNIRGKKNTGPCTEFTSWLHHILVVTFAQVNDALWLLVFLFLNWEQWSDPLTELSEDGEDGASRDAWELVPAEEALQGTGIRHPVPSPVCGLPPSLVCSYTSAGFTWNRTEAAALRGLHLPESALEQWPPAGSWQTGHWDMKRYTSFLPRRLTAHILKALWGAWKPLRKLVYFHLIQGSQAYLTMEFPLPFSP